MRLKKWYSSQSKVCCAFLAVQDSSITDIVCRSPGSIKELISTMTTITTMTTMTKMTKMTTMTTMTIKMTMTMTMTMTMMMTYKNYND